MKIYLSIVTLMLVGAIGLGVYVWYTVQELNTTISNIDGEEERLVAPTMEVRTSPIHSE